MFARAPSLLIDLHGTRGPLESVCRLEPKKGFAIGDILGAKRICMSPDTPNVTGRRRDLAPTLGEQLELPNLMRQPNSINPIPTIDIIFMSSYR